MAFVVATAGMMDPAMDCTVHREDVALLMW